MVNFKGRHYEFDEIREKVISGDISEDKDFIIEALRACFSRKMEQLWLMGMG